jgi:DNA gyrase/topoisomerase IV subunit B
MVNAGRVAPPLSGSLSTRRTPQVSSPAVRHARGTDLADATKAQFRAYDRGVATARSSYEDIVVLEGLEAVRQRPGMYLGDTGQGGLAHMAFEVVANALDQVLAGHASTIEVTLDAEGWVSVRDDGRGLRVDRTESGHSFIERVFTTLSHRPTVDDHHPHVHVTPNLSGVGVGPLCACSERLELETHRKAIGTLPHSPRARCATKVPAQVEARSCGTATTPRSSGRLRST